MGGKGHEGTSVLSQADRGWKIYGVGVAFVKADSGQGVLAFPGGTGEVKKQAPIAWLRDHHCDGRGASVIRRHTEQTTPDPDLWWQRSGEAGRGRGIRSGFLPSGFRAVSQIDT